MTFIIFVIILGVLVLVHELGHFLLAKQAGVRVEEFGFGYPPRAISLGCKWGTLFSINWIPFGGFVKILGENYENEASLEQSSSSQSAERSTDIFLLKNSSSSAQSASLASSPHFAPKNFLAGSKKFTQVSKKWQAAILVAGVTFNFIFAWFLFSLGFLIGVPTPVENSFGAEVKNPVLTVTNILTDSPAQKAGLKTGDQIVGITDEKGQALKELLPEKVSDFLNNGDSNFALKVVRGKQDLLFQIKPTTGLVAEKKIIGISMDLVGIAQLSLPVAVLEGAKTTFKLTYLTIFGIFDLAKNALMGQADVSQVTGPIGIVGLVGDASRLGFAYLLTFTALISINLAVINLIPFPALDGGRLLFVLVEAIIKKPINAKFASVANTVGFFILIGLMLIVTYRDILHLFN